MLLTMILSVFLVPSYGNENARKIIDDKALSTSAVIDNGTARNDLEIYLDNRTYKYGLRDSSKNVLIKPQYDKDEIKYETGNLIAVKKGDLWGYINISNQTVIPHAYTGATGFFGDYAFVTKSKDPHEKEWRIINTKGNFITNQSFKTVSTEPNMLKLANSNYVIVAEEKYGTTKNSSIWLLKNNEVFSLKKFHKIFSSETIMARHVSDEITLIKFKSSANKNSQYIFDTKGNEIASVFSGYISLYNKYGLINETEDKQGDPTAKRFIAVTERNISNRKSITIYNANGEKLRDKISYRRMTMGNNKYIILHWDSYNNAKNIKQSIREIIDFDGNEIFNANSIDKSIMKDLVIAFTDNNLINDTLITYNKKSQMYQVRTFDMKLLFEYKCELLTPLKGNQYVATVKDEWGNTFEIILNEKGQKIK